MAKKIALILLCGILSLNISAQHPYEPLLGFWKGTLKIMSGDSLSLVMAVLPDGDSVKVELDSPDQFVTGIAVDFFSFQQDSIEFKVRSMATTYTGTYDSSTQMIVGTFMQGKFKRKLSLSKIKERPVIYRPQEPHPPYPYREEEVTILHPDTKSPWIQGTLTLPENKSPRALVILISGSGWQDRDETIMGHKPFKVMADFLTRHDYAVFRYDDLPQYFFRQATTKDFADAVSLIIDSLSAQPRFQELPAGLLGHSEGGLVAFMTAACDKRVNFVISMAGMADGMKNTLLYQIEAITGKDSNFTKEDIDASLEISNKIYSAIEKSKTKEKALEKCKRILENYDAKYSDEQKNKIGLSFENRMATLSIIASPWYYYLFHIDTKDFIKKVRCPVYALNGENDLQVDYRTHLEVLRLNLPPNKQTKIVSFPKLNHLFQESETGLPSEYGLIEQTISPDVPESIVKWLIEIGY